MCKLIKFSVLGVVGLMTLGFIWHKTDLGSYIRSGAHSMHAAVKDQVPVEFELRRARDLVEEIIPEMHANIRLIAQEEVEIAQLRRDIEESKKNIAIQKEHLLTLRDKLDVQQTSYRINGYTFSRQQVREDVANRLERLREAEMVLAGKEKLLNAREKSLAAAVQMLEKTRSQKAILESKIESLEAQHRLVKAASVGSRVQVDDSKLAQTDRLINQIKKRLDVAERVLAHEGKFTEPTVTLEKEIDEKELLTQVDDYLNPRQSLDDAVAAESKYQDANDKADADGKDADELAKASR